MNTQTALIVNGVIRVPGLTKIVIDYITPDEKKNMLGELYCETGFYEMCEKITDAINIGFIHACRGGHKEIIALMMSKGVAEDIKISSAYEIYANNPRLSDFVMGLDYDEKDGEPTADYLNGALETACRQGKTSVAGYLWDRGATDLNRGLAAACAEGNICLARYVINIGADDLNRGLTAACANGHAAVVKFMINEGATKCESCGVGRDRFRRA